MHDHSFLGWTVGDGMIRSLGNRPTLSYRGLGVDVTGPGDYDPATKERKRPHGRQKGDPPLTKRKRKRG